MQVGLIGTTAQGASTDRPDRFPGTQRRRGSIKSSAKGCCWVVEQRWVWVGLDRRYRWVRGCSSAGREPGLLGWVGQHVGVLQGATGRSERVHLGCDLG